MSARSEPLIWNGRTHFGWPWSPRSGALDILSVSEERLVLTSLLGELHFRPSTVLRIERAGFIPCFYKGVLISHRREGYPGSVGFIPHNASTQEILQGFKTMGFWVMP